MASALASAEPQFACAQQAASTLLDALDGIETVAVGDCKKPFNLAEAIAAGNICSPFQQAIRQQLLVLLGKPTYSVCSQINKHPPGKAGNSGASGRVNCVLGPIRPLFLHAIQWHRLSRWVNISSAWRIREGKRVARNGRIDQRRYSSAARQP